VRWAKSLTAGTEPCLGPCSRGFFRQNGFGGKERNAARRRNDMAWTTPVLVEICAGLEINGYLPPEI
jgi:hypothetical protein